jgi:hypothetical protein
MEFKEIHKILNTPNKVHQMQAVSGKWDSNTTLAAVQKLCSKANDMFNTLNLMNKKNISQGTGRNCGTLDHTSNKCPLPCNEAKITKTKEVRTKSVTLMDAVLVVLVMDVDTMTVVVAVGVTVPILGESGVPIKVILLLPVQIHLWVMESKSKMESG